MVLKWCSRLFLFFILQIFFLFPLKTFFFVFSSLPVNIVIIICILNFFFLWVWEIYFVCFLSQFWVCFILPSFSLFSSSFFSSSILWVDQLRPPRYLHYLCFHPHPLPLQSWCSLSFLPTPSKNVLLQQLKSTFSTFRTVISYFLFFSWIVMPPSFKCTLQGIKSFQLSQHCKWDLKNTGLH